MIHYEKIKDLDSSKEIDEKEFYKLVIDFRNSFLESKKYDENRLKHRKPKEYLNEVLQSSFAHLEEIGKMENMKDIEERDGKTSYGYVYSRVKWIFEADKSLNLYHSIREYCRITNKNFNTIALLMAEYRGVEKVKEKIRIDNDKLNRKIKIKSNVGLSDVSNMSKNSSFAASGILELRSKIMNKLPSGDLLSLLAMQDKVAKMTSSYDFMIQAAQRQPPISNIDILAKFITAETSMPRAIKSASFISRIFDFKPVPELHTNRYLDLFGILTDNNAVKRPSDSSIDDSQLFEVEYEFTQINRSLDDENQESKRQVILLTESYNIKKIIIDIYRNHNRLLDVSSRQFEELIAELLSNQGFKVELTKQTRDGGYDIIALCHMDNQAPQKWLVECKRLTKQKVGVEIIRGFKEVVQANHVNRGIIATTSYFSTDALKKQQETPYLLDFRDKDAVMKWIIDYGNQKG